MNVEVISSNPIHTLNVIPKNDKVPQKPITALDVVSGVSRFAVCSGAIGAVSSLTDSLSRYLLGSCRVAFEYSNFDECVNEEYFREICVQNLDSAKISLCLFAGGLTLSYLPTVVNKIKNLWNPEKKEIVKSDANSLSKEEIAKVGGFVLCALSAVKTFNSMFHFSNAGIRALLGRCVTETSFNGSEITEYVCRNSLQTGNASLLSAGLLLAGGLLVLNSDKLIGRVKKLFS